MNADQIKRMLQLEPHPVEGGAFRRTYESAQAIASAHGPRPIGSAIYYLLEPGTFSELHRLDADECFHFYLGGPVEMLHLYPDGRSAHFVLGQDLLAGQHVQLHVPAGTWQGARLAESGQFALLGCSVTPAFEYSGYESGHCTELCAQWPHEAESIRALTRR